MRAEQFFAMRGKVQTGHGRVEFDLSRHRWIGWNARIDIP